MAERRPNYVAVALMLLLTIVITYWAQTRPPIVLVRSNLASLPASIGTWRTEDSSVGLDKDSLEAWGVSRDEAIKRVYIDEDGTPLELLVIYKGQNRRGWHVSEMCFGGSGYNVKQETTRISYAGADHSAVKLVVQDPNNGLTSLSVYFFAEGPDTESNFAVQQLKMAANRLRPSEYGWAYVRATSPVIVSEQVTEDKIRSFFATVSDSLFAALTTPRDPNK